MNYPIDEDFAIINQVLLDNVKNIDEQNKARDALGRIYYNLYLNDKGPRYFLSKIPKAKDLKK